MGNPRMPRMDRIQGFMDIYEVDKDTARIMCEAADAAFQAGVNTGRAEAQRFFRLALGVEVPTFNEKATWNNPVPLRRDG